VRAWAVRRKVAEERWSGMAIKEMKGTPARPDPNMPGSDIPIRIKVTMEFPDAVAEHSIPQRNEDNSRRAYLKKRDFEKFGYDEDCEGCRRLMAGMAPRPHKDACRTRMEQHLEKEENPRWKRAADAKEDKFWEARKQEEDEMEKEKVDETKAEETKVEESNVEEEAESPNVPADKAAEKRSAEDTGGTGSSNDAGTSILKKPKVADKQGEKRSGDESTQSTRRVRIEEKHGEKRAGEEWRRNSEKT
jgi:hypothetical protein